MAYGIDLSSMEKYRQGGGGGTPREPAQEGEFFYIRNPTTGELVKIEGRRPPGIGTGFDVSSDTFARLTSGNQSTDEKQKRSSDINSLIDREIDRWSTIHGGKNTGEGFSQPIKDKIGQLINFGDNPEEDLRNNAEAISALVLNRIQELKTGTGASAGNTPAGGKPGSTEPGIQDIQGYIDYIEKTYVYPELTPEETTAREKARTEYYGTQASEGVSGTGLSEQERVALANVDDWARSTGNEGTGLHQDARQK